MARTPVLPEATLVRALRPTEAFKGAVAYVRATSILVISEGGILQSSEDTADLLSPQNRTGGNFAS